MRYVLDFGSANTGGAPTWVSFARLDTLAAVLPQPTLTEIGTSGQFYFDVDWGSLDATSITFKATLGGVELSDVISSSAVTQGTSVASTGLSSTDGYSTAATLLNRAAVQCGLDSVSDPFASTDPNFILLREILDTLGDEIAAEVKGSRIRECTITTAGGATSYVLPADYQEMVDGTGWNGTLPLAGPVTPQRDRFLKAWGVGTLAYIEYRLEGNRLTFPVAPADGLTITFLYVSSYWVQSAASGTGPDADHATAGTDYILFDPVLVALGLKLRWLEVRGFDTALPLAAYLRRLEFVKGKVLGGRVLSLHAGDSGERLVDGWNLPPTNWGSV